MFYDELFRNLKLTVPTSKTGRKGFPKEAMLCAFIVMKCESFTQITDLADYLNNNRLIAHYCGFNIMEPLPSYWTYDRFLKNLDHAVLEEVMASQVKKLFTAGIVDASFIGLDSTLIAANTKLNNPKSFAKNRFSKENHPKSDPDCALGVHTASNQHNERNFEFYWGYKSHVLVDCISGLPLYELTTPANISDSTVAKEILDAANRIVPMKECTFLADKGYDVTAIYDHVRMVYEGDCFIPINKRGTKNPEKLPSGNPICEAGLAMHKDGKTSDGYGGLRQKFCCPFRKSKPGECPCDHKNWNNGKKNRGCTKYSAIPDGYRLSIDRACKQFRSIYALRTECERYNSRFKATGQERLWIRNSKSAANLNSIAHIAALAVAYAAVITHENVSYRALKALRRTA